MPKYVKREKNETSSYLVHYAFQYCIYKIYAMMLEERLRERIEEKGILPDTHADFIRGQDRRHVCTESRDRAKNIERSICIFYDREKLRTTMKKK